MRKIYLLLLLMLTVSGIFAQDLGKNAALQLVTNNSKNLGLNRTDIENSIVSNAYHNKISGTDLVYLQQSFKGIPVYNQVQTLAFKNGQLVSNAGVRIKAIEQKTNNGAANPAVAAETAIRTAMQAKNVKIPASFSVISNENNKKIVYAKAAESVTENISAELMWVPVNNGTAVQLAWQVYLVPEKSSDYWLIRVDANSNQVIGESNLTVYCNFKHGDNHQHEEACNTKDNGLQRYEAQKAALANGPEIVNGATYRVIPFPAESPNHAGGAHALVTDPWNAAPGNATSLKWHSDGTNDYTYTRGNNTWAYQDRGAGQNNPSEAKSTASTTGPDPLTFNFTPNLNQSPIFNSPAPNKDFNVTNLFYWNNVIHDVMYQYGFNEVAGNFQVSNQGRGGLGNDYVRAEAQDASGSENANFSTPADGGLPRMQMYLWSKANKPAFTIVNAPASSVGNVSSVEANFTLATGAPANNTLAMRGPITADVVYVNDNTGATHDGCVAPSNSLTGKIALLHRGNCDFLVKVQTAQTAGAVAVIVINNVAGAPIVMGAANAPAGIIIPAVMVSDVDGAALIAQLNNGLNITLAPDMIDGDVDNGVVVHEFGHGISNRLTGGPAQSNCLGSAEQMGEGWSDYYSLMLTQNWATSNVNSGFSTPRGIGTYAAGQAITGNGIRTQRYSTDFTVNNLVFTSTITAQQHTRGELWAATLWDMTWNIIQQTNSITPSIYNAAGTGGNIIALKLVTEGMKLQPCGPGFIDGRDAILQADQILYNGQYSCAIKEAFRRRGMGPLASQGSANLLNDQVPDFSPILTMKLSQSAPTVTEGQNVTFTNTLSSCGPVSNFTLRDTLPANVTYVSGGTYDAGTRVVSFPVTFTAAGTQTYSFVVTANTGSYYAPVTYVNEPILTAAIPATLTQTSTTTSVWAGTTAQSNSAPASLLTPNSAVPSEQILRTTSAFTLGSNQSSASFFHWINSENSYDGGVIEISTDAGANWIDLDTKITQGYYNGKIAADAGTTIINNKAFTGNSGAFFKTSVNLSSYAGQSANFRWRFVSDNGTGGTGWFVDDILIKNEAVINMRSTLFTGTTIVAYADTVTLIQQANTCTNAAITTQPANSNACTGGNASFTVTATGTNVSYQWQVSTDAGVTWNNVATATTATLNLTGITAGMNNNRYRVIVSNTCPSTVTSAAATLSVVTATNISGQPASVSVCAGGNAGFNVTATGTALTYQWQVSTDAGVTWNNVAGATTQTLNLIAVTAAMNNNRYRVLLSDCAPAGLLSAAATLTVNAAVAITTQPAATSACAGGNASFTVVATSAATYQWQVSTDAGVTWNNIATATSATLNLTAVTVAMNNNRYRVIVSNTCPSTVTSAAVALTVASATAITTQPVSTAVCAAANASFTVVATGTAVTYQWQVSTDAGVTFTNIPSATTATLNLTAVTAAMNNNRYRVVLSDCNPAGLTSAAVTLTVNSPAAITTQPAATTTICTGANATFTVVATGTNITYQWQLSTDGGTTWNNIATATAASYQVTGATATANGNQYRVIVSGTCVPASVTSTVSVLSVNNSIVVSLQPQSVALCAGANASFSITAAGSGLTYQWQVSTNSGTSFTNVPGATSNTLTLTAVQPSMNNNQYRVVLNGACASNVNSSAATLTVNSSVTITTQPTDVLGCVGTPAVFNVVATGTTITYQWQLSTDGGSSWNNITGATLASYSIANPAVSQNGHKYRVIVSGVPCGSVTSNAANLSVNIAPGVVMVAAQYSVITPSTPTGLFATVSPAGTYSYAWYRNAGLLINTTASIPVNTDQLGTYYVVVTNAQGCSKTSNEVTIGDSSSNLLFVYPNPNNGQFQVRYHSNSTSVEERTLVVYNASGNRVYNASYSVSGPYGMMQVKIPSAAVGTYFVYLLDSKGSKIASGRVVIER